jgi:hypothetical protein
MGHEGVKTRPRGSKDEWQEDDDRQKNGLTSHSMRFTSLRCKFLESGDLSCLLIAECWAFRGYDSVGILWLSMWLWEASAWARTGPKQKGVNMVLQAKNSNRQVGNKGRDEWRGVAKWHGQQAKSHQLDSLMAKTGQAGKWASSVGVG